MLVAVVSLSRQRAADSSTRRAKGYGRHYRDWCMSPDYARRLPSARKRDFCGFIHSNVTSTATWRSWTKSARLEESTETVVRAVLTFHSIDDSGSILSYPPKTFGKLLDALKRCDIPILDLSALMQPYTPRGVALTFDDGMRS